MSINLEDIQQAAKRLDGVAIKTPLLSCVELNARVDAKVFLKPECLQHIGAFKFRGAYNRLSQLSSAEKARGVVAFSSGNHAQGVAYAAKLLGMKATIVMPSDAPIIKKEGTEKLGAKIRLYDRDTESREEISAAIAADTGAVLVPAFDDVDVIAGQGTCGLEIMQQMQDIQCVPDIVLSPCGGGGLLGGISTAVKGCNASTLVYGVEPENYDDHSLSKQAGKRVTINPQVKTSCDALMATAPGEITWSINSKTVEDFLTVSEDDVAHAISFAFRYLKLVVEPGGAVALAALLQNKLDVAGKAVAVILSGGNVDSRSFAEYLEKFPSP
ncbi:MAG: pyridoxal-5'-phosphate-dependent protein [SAR86 cluster bacterium]|uniref:Pyridoxal-5'-phosphate-dependent protein n=1 Tax=SAR86 cluster bacterium TaxID=2030880 RepID=A0A2A5AVX8_9GAMM|nr:MAG: pyridoxal-5'-phosphate-dependent protein [SAR86 cluster bacterium]